MKTKVKIRLPDLWIHEATIDAPPDEVFAIFRRLMKKGKTESFSDGERVVLIDFSKVILISCERILTE